MSAWICGILGVVSTYAIGVLRLELTGAETVLCVFASIASGMTALLIYSTAMRTPWLRRHVMFGPLSTWLCFLFLYFGLELAIASPLRASLFNFAWLVVPTILATGFTIVAFGPIQDRIVARAPKKRERTRG